MAAHAAQPLFSATERLVNALNRLERNLQNAAPSAPEDRGQLALFGQENEELKAERAALTQAINDLQQRYDDLHKAASKVYGKLDDSIKRLTTIIEH